jgi:hypothetical protein
MNGNDGQGDQTDRNNVGAFNRKSSYPARATSNALVCMTKDICNIEGVVFTTQQLIYLIPLRKISPGQIAVES